MDGWDSILTSLPGVGGYGAFAAVVVVSIRMLIKADSRYHAEVADHERTQTALDDERDRRRKAEDDLGAMALEVRDLRDQVFTLQRQVAALTAAVGSP
jgi:hypothetical protein